jgi:hypothetical protein
VLVDYEVTGSHAGSVGKPKFALKNLWMHVLLPSLDISADACPFAQPRHLDEGGRSVRMPWLSFKKTMRALTPPEGDYREWMNRSLKRVMDCGPLGTPRSSLLYILVHL